MNLVKKSRSKATPRGERILDAAGTLFARYGYDKTTISEVAEAAGVSKGAVYLHVQSKTELFERVIVREMSLNGSGWLSALDDDPKGDSIEGLYRSLLSAVHSTPLMAAIFRRDGVVFGSYLRQPDNIYRRLQEIQSESHRVRLARRLQDAGAIREDISAPVIGRVMDILAFGLVTVGEVLGSAGTPPVEDLVRGIAVLMDSALASGAAVRPGTIRSIVRSVYEELYRQFEDLLQTYEEEPDNE